MIQKLRNPPYHFTDIFRLDLIILERLHNKRAKDPGCFQNIRVHAGSGSRVIQLVNGASDKNIDHGLHHQPVFNALKFAQKILPAISLKALQHANGLFSGYPSRSNLAKDLGQKGDPEILIGPKTLHQTTQDFPESFRFMELIQKALDFGRFKCTV